MSKSLSKTDLTSRDLARGRNLKIGAIAAPFVLAILPMIVFLIISLVLSGSPIFAVSTFLLGLVTSIAGFVVGLIVSGVLMYRHQNWTAEMRERIATNGIRAEEIDWFRKELKLSEKRALKAMTAADPLLEDAYRDTLASRLTATRIVKSSRRELQFAQRRQAKLKSLKSKNANTFQEEIKADAEKIGSIHSEAKQMLAEAESRLQMIEAAASRGGTLADSELALKKLSARASELPLALEAARMTDEIRAELERESLDAKTIPRDEIGPAISEER